MLLRLSVLSVCLTFVLCDHGYGAGFGPVVGGVPSHGGGGFGGHGGSGHGGGGFGGQAAAAAGCKPVTQFVTNVQTVVQEQINTNIVEEKVAQFETETSLEYATVTTGTVAYVTTTVLVTDFNTQTRTVTRHNTLTSTQLVYIPTLQTAYQTAVNTLTHTTTAVAYETVFTTNYITSTLTTVSTKLQDSVVYDVAYETELNFVASPVTTTVVDVIQDFTTQTVQVQGYLPPVITVTLDNVEYQTQVQYETAPVYITSREQVTEYQTIYRDVPVISTVTATVDCYGQAVKSGATQGSVTGTDLIGIVSDNIPGGSGGFLVQPGVLVDHNSQTGIGHNYL